MMNAKTSSRLVIGWFQAAAVIAVMPVSQVSADVPSPLPEPVQPTGPIDTGSTAAPVSADLCPTGREARTSDRWGAAARSTYCPATDVGMLASDGSTVISSNTCGYSDDFEDEGYGCNYGDGYASDEIYQFTVDQTGLWQMDTSTICAGWDTTLMIREETGGGCPGDFVACDGDSGHAACGNYESKVLAFLTTGTTYYLVVDGFYYVCGAYDVTSFRTSGPEFRLQPIEVTEVGCWWIEDHEDVPGKPSEVVIQGPLELNSEITLELHLRGWGEVPGTPELAVYQAHLNGASSYASGDGVDLQPSGGCCPGIECFDPNWSACIDTGRPDYVFSGVMAVHAVDVTSLRYRWGAVAFSCPPFCKADDGQIYYGGTLVLDIPIGASGTYTIGFDQSDPGAMADENGEDILPLTLTPVIIHVLDSASDFLYCEGFEDISVLPGSDWAFINNSQPLGTIGWFQGNPLAFPAHNGPANSYIASNYNAAGSKRDPATISNWLILPETSLENGMVFSFFTRTATGSIYPDRLQVRMSLAGASTDVGSTAESVGVFTHLLLDINPNLVIGGYPEEWTFFSVELTGIGPRAVDGRLAFRYYCTDGGPSGDNSNYVGVDTVTLADVFDPSAPRSELGRGVCTTKSDCTDSAAGADCVGGRCYIPKNRYLTIDPTGNLFPVSHQVELVQATDYPTAEGRTWWLSDPQCYDYPDGDPVLPRPTTCEGPDRFGWVSKPWLICVGGPNDGDPCATDSDCAPGICLSEMPPGRLWSENPVHITGCDIVPAVTYYVRASTGHLGWSDPLEIATAHNPEGEAQSWGDITGGPVSGMSGLWLAPERSMNFGDIGDAIRTFENRGDATGFPPRVWVDVEINQVINFGDVGFLIKAFEGTAYAELADLEFIGVHPAACP